MTANRAAALDELVNQFVHEENEAAPSLDPPDTVPKPVATTSSKVAPTQPASTPAAPAPVTDDDFGDFEFQTDPFEGDLMF